jgi:ribulose-phosphate 3-epimerase
MSRNDSPDLPRIAPSILAANFSELGNELRAIERAGADEAHVDVMDGRFVPNITIGPPVVEAAKACTKLPLDVHLMIVEPERYIEKFATAGASTISVHAETCPHLHGTVGQIRNAGARPCVALNPGTPAEAVEVVLPDVDQVLVMTVNPGFGGQSFIESMLPKIEKIRGWIEARGLDVDIEVDGGIANDTIARAASAGANVFVAGTAVFKCEDYRKAIDGLRQRATR